MRGGGREAGKSVVSSTGDLDPVAFDDSEAAVAAFEEGDWLPLARLAGPFVAQSNFSMRNLEPPRRCN